MENSIKSGIKWFAMLAFVLMVCPGHHTAGGTVEASEFDSTFDDVYEVYVVKHDWHTAIVLKTKDVSPADWPEIDRYRQYNYVEAGWGDEAFYQSEDGLIWLGAKAILVPTPSVILCFGYDSNPAIRYAVHSHILRLKLDADAYAKLCRFLSNSFKRTEEGIIQNSKYRSDSKVFFLAEGNYHGFNTCNTWVAHAFRQAGLKVRRWGILTSDQLFRQLAKLPEAEQVR